MLRQLLRDILSKSVYHICLFRFFVSKTLKLVEQLHIFFHRGIAQKGKGSCFMLTQCHAGLRSWKWRRKFLVGTFCGAKIQSLNFLTSPVGPKIYHGNVGTSPVGPIIDDCSGKHAIYLRFLFHNLFTIFPRLITWCHCLCRIWFSNAHNLHQLSFLSHSQVNYD